MSRDDCVCVLCACVCVSCDGLFMKGFTCSVSLDLDLFSLSRAPLCTYIHTCACQLTFSHPVTSTHLHPLGDLSFYPLRQFSLDYTGLKKINTVKMHFVPSMYICAWACEHAVRMRDIMVTLQCKYAMQCTYLL